jgi:predicted alpha/beta superfamily hydrolase
MRRNAAPLIAILLLVASSCSRRPESPSQAVQSKTVKIQFIVAVPADTGENDAIYLSGNLDEIGHWNAQGLPLKRQDNGEYTASVELPRGAKLEFKANRGSWATVEKSAGGFELYNRTMTLDGDKIVRLTVERWRDPGMIVPPTPTIVGDVRYHRDFHSKNLSNNRNLIVWLPPGYDADPSRRYPVLYLHDGQNVFDASTSFAGEWRADETATRLIWEKKIEPIIMVGIENSGPARVDEYTPTRATTQRAGTTIEEGGQGELYEKFLIEEVKPFIDGTYRTMSDREHTAVAGSSLGGLITLHLAWKHSDVFGMCGCMSPSLWWDERKMLIALETDNRWMKRVRLWVDMGTAEGSGTNAEKNLAAARELDAIMHRAGLREGIDYRYAEFEGAAHNEQSWADRFDQVLLFLFGTGR